MPARTPLFSFDRSASPPPLRTDEDPKRALASLLTYGNWLTAHRPDPILVKRFTAPGSEIRRAYEHDLGLLMRADKRGFETRNGSNEITIVSHDAHSFTARVVERITAQRIVDRRGRVVSERRFSEPTTYIDVVVRVDGRWFLASVHETGSAS